VIEETAGVVAGLRARAGDDAVDLELLLLPLRHRGRTQARVIGTLSAARLPEWIGLRPVEGLETLSLRVLVPGAGPPRADPSFDRASEKPFDRRSDPARRHGLVVHQGGLA
jgi:hypothetical protein